MKYLIFFLLLASTVYADPIKKPIEGIYYQVYEEDFEKMKVTIKHEIKDKHGKYHKIKFKTQPHLKSGSHILLKGIETNGEIEVDENDIFPSESTDAFLPPIPQEEQKTLIILMNFQDRTTQPFTISAVQNTMFNNMNSVDKYYREMSYQKTWFTGDVVGWVTIADSYTPCDYYHWGDLADQKALELGYDVNNYNRTLYIMPSTACTFGGVAQIGGNRAWSNGYNDNRLFAHELGHTLGVLHAATWKCGSKSVDVSGNCTMDEYGEKYDTMGFWNIFQMNAPHKTELEFPNPENIQVVDTNGIYAIASIEKPSSNPQIIKIKKNDRLWDWYYISYRSGYGFDASLPYDIKNGVSIHIQDINQWEPSRFIDTTPGDGSFSNATLKDGKFFYDQINGLRIKQLSHNVDSATIQVEFGAQPDLNPPIVSISKHQVGIFATAMDDFGVDRVEFWINGILKSTDRSSPYSYFWDAIPNMDYIVEMKTYDGFGNMTSSVENIKLGIQ